MDRAPAFSDSRISMGQWLSGVLLLLGAIWLGLLTIELGFSALSLGTSAGFANFWTERVIYGAVASLLCIAAGSLVFYLSRRHSHRHHHRRRETIAQMAPGQREPASSTSNAADDDESVSFDAPPKRKVRVKVRVKQRTRQSRGRDGSK